MNITGMQEIVKMSYQIKRPALFLSSPGVGKSSVVAQATEELAGVYDEPFGLIELRAASLNPGEIADVKYIKGDFVANAIQAWVPTAEKVARGECPARGILFLDEIADSGSLSIQSTLQQLLLDGKLGSATLAPGWHPLAASNRVKDKAAAGRLSRAMINRVMCATVDPDPDVFYDWGLTNGIAAEVLAFVRFQPDCVSDGLEVRKEENQAFCSPRSLHIASDILQTKHKVSVPLRNETLLGTIGEGVGSTFTGFLRIMDSLPDLNQILKDPTNYPVPSKVDVQYATIGALHQRMTKQNARDIMKFFIRLPTEMSVVAIKDAGKVATQKLGDGNLVFRCPEFIAFSKDNIKFAI